MPAGAGGHTKNIRIRNLQFPNCGIFCVSQDHLNGSSVSIRSVAFWLVFVASAAALVGLIHTVLTILDSSE